MGDSMSEYFEGFPEEMVDFFWELRMNNNMEWFKSNKKRYEDYVKKPMELFSKELCDRMNAMDIGETFTTQISRINRDIRFSKDKSPYRAHRWVVLKYRDGRWQENPCLYFQIGPESYSFGFGFYETNKNYLERYRKKMMADLETIKGFEKMISEQDAFVSDVELYKKNFAPEGIDENIKKWFQFKGISFSTTSKLTPEVFNNEIVDIVEEGYKFILPMFMYFKDI